MEHAKQNCMRCSVCLLLVIHLSLQIIQKATKPTDMVHRCEAAIIYVYTYALSADGVLSS